MNPTPGNIFSFSRNNDTASIAALLENGNSPNERDSKGRTPLHICCSFDCFESAQLLLRTETCDINLQDTESGYTALHRALYSGNHRIALLLIKHGANALGRDTQDKANIAPVDHEGLSPLDLLTQQLASNTSKMESLCTEVVAFGKADFFLGIVLPKAADDVIKPRPIMTLASLNIECIACSKYHSAAITTEGSLYTW